MTTEPQPPDPTPGYPVILDMAGRRCLVVGGGPVAARRARSLVASGGQVTVVAPEVVAAIDRLGAPSASAVGIGTLEIARRRYEPGEAGHYDFVVAATGAPGVDGAVVSDATAAAVPVNSADRAAPGSVQLPAVHRDGPIVVAVSTGGASPALARWLRDRIAGSLPPYVAVLCDLLDEARTAVRTAGRATDSVDWETVISDLVVPLVESGRIDEARSELLALCRPSGEAGPGGSR